MSNHVEVITESFIFILALFASSDVAKLIKEISIMLSFSHPNVMTMRGVCVDHECPLLIMQFMSNGSVLEYVKHQKEDLLLVNEANTMQVTIKYIIVLCMSNLTYTIVRTLLFSFVTD